MLLALLSLATTAPAPCAPATLRPAVAAASRALDAGDPAVARAALAPVAACPVTDGITYAGHVLRAEMAVRDNDWPTARAMLAGVGPHPENGLSGRAGFARLRADQGLGDAAAFAADRAALIAANDGRLAANGPRLDGFAVPGGRIEAYRTRIDQGAFHRLYEFIAVPDDPAAYPVSIELTDDATVDANAALMNPGQPASQHLWFLDLYTCGGHSTLPPLPNGPAGAAPDYAALRAAVVRTLADGKLLRAAPPPATECGGGRWVLPGLGGTIPPPAR